MRVTLHCENLRRREEAHRYLADMLWFPSYYGRNLDALWDCLTDLPTCTVVLVGADILRSDGGYGAKILKVFEEAALANRRLTIAFADEPSADGEETDTGGTGETE